MKNRTIMKRKKKKFNQDQTTKKKMKLLLWWGLLVLKTINLSFLASNSSRAITTYKNCLSKTQLTTLYARAAAAAFLLNKALEELIKGYKAKKKKIKCKMLKKK